MAYSSAVRLAFKARCWKSPFSGRDLTWCINVLIQTTQKKREKIGNPAWLGAVRSPRPKITIKASIKYHLKQGRGVTLSSNRLRTTEKPDHAPLGEGPAVRTNLLKRQVSNAQWHKDRAFSPQPTNQSIIQSVNQDYLCSNRAVQRALHHKDMKTVLKTSNKRYNLMSVIIKIIHSKYVGQCFSYCASEAALSRRVLV